MPDSIIKIVVGKVGSGKSWYCVAKILDALMAGEVVVTNLALNWAACESYFGKVRVPRSNYRFVSSERLESEPGVITTLLAEGGCTLVIDEVHLWLGNRNWRDNERKAGEFQVFLSQARKLDVSCYFISQDERNVDALLLRQCSNIVRLVNWHHFPLLGSLIPLPLTVARICKPDGVTSVGREWIWRTGQLGKCYDTKQKFLSIALTGRSAAPVLGKRAKAMSYGMMLVSLGVVCVAVGSVFDYRSRQAAALRSEQEAADAAKRAEAKRLADLSRPPVPAPVLPDPAAMLHDERPVVRGPVLPAERVNVEVVLPSVYACNGAYFSLVGGHRLTHGSYFLAGSVVGWKRDGGTVLVAIDSPDLPFVRLHYANRSRPFLYDYDGGVVRRSSHSGGNASRRVAPVGSGMVSPVVQAADPGPVEVGQGDSGPVYDTPSAPGHYSAPPPFIPPPMGTTQSVGDFVGERQGSPTLPHGFGTRVRRSSSR